MRDPIDRRATGCTHNPMSTLILERHDATALVIFNRPQAMNALNQEMRLDLHAMITALNADDTVRAIVLTGEGRAFTAGLDLKELSTDANAMSAATTDRPEANPVAAIEASRKPVIGAINGVAITGGFEVALACDMLIASTEARFADTHARVGIMPGWGLSQKLSRLIGIYRAKELSLTGNFLDAQTAADWGLVNRVVEPHLLIETALNLAADIATVPEQAVADYKALIDDGFGRTFADGLAAETAFSTARNAQATPDKIAQSRLDVTARGRAQKD
jgi:enoyl-CoA hydratase